jgi:uncharacterized protein YjiS (DUF1127 family)
MASHMKTTRAAHTAEHSFSNRLTGLGALFKTWLMRRNTRATLARLDGHMLRDVGLDPAMARAECARRFWQE